MAYKKPTDKQLDAIYFIEKVMSGYADFKGVTRGQAGKFIRLNMGTALEWEEEEEMYGIGAGEELNGL